MRRKNSINVGRKITRNRNKPIRLMKSLRGNLKNGNVAPQLSMIRRLMTNSSVIDTIRCVKRQVETISTRQTISRTLAHRRVLASDLSKARMTSNMETIKEKKRLKSRLICPKVGPATEVNTFRVRPKLKKNGMSSAKWLLFSSVSAALPSSGTGASIVNDRE